MVMRTIDPKKSWQRYRQGYGLQAKLGGMSLEANWDVRDPLGFRSDPSCVLYLPLYKLDGTSFMSRDHYGHLCTATVGTTAIDVGSAASDRASTTDPSNTYIDLANPSNKTGQITSVEIWAATNITGMRVGSFYRIGTADFKCRDSVTIGNVTAGSKQTFTGFSFAIREGDYIGCYFATGTLEYDLSGGSDVYYKAVEAIDPGDEITGCSLGSGDAISLYTTGTTYGSLWIPQGHSFDGNDVIDCGASTVLDLTSFTLLAWVKTSTAARVILAKGSGTTTQYIIDNNGGSGKLRFFGYAATVVKGITSTSRSDGTSITDNAWTLVGGTFDSTTWKIYRNAVLDGSVTDAATLTATTETLQIGARQNATYWLGSQGEVWLYNRALTPLEIQWLYLSTCWRYA